MLNKRLTLLIAGFMVAASFLAACNHNKETEDQIEDVLTEAEMHIEKAKMPMQPMPTDTVTTKDDIWLGQDSFKITGGEPLPAAMESGDAVTYSTYEEKTFADIISELSDLTGLRFSIEELRANNELPTETMAVNYTGSLSGLLNQVSNKYSIWWRYRKGQVNFYKMETRVFTIYALPVESSMTASLKGTAMGSGSQDSNLGMDTKVDLTFWKNIEDGLKQVYGKDASASNLVISKVSGTVTVTAAPYTIQKMARYIQDLNEKMSRQVAISVKLLQVTIDTEDQYGLDLSVLYNSGSINAVASGATTFATSGNTMPGQLALTLLDGKFANSEAIIQALSTQGKTSLVTSTSVTTLNNKVAPVQVTTTENYVKETTIEKNNSYNSNNDSSSVQMTTDTLNYGFTMEILPRILDNGRLLVLFTMSLSDLISLTQFTSDGTDPSEDPTTSTGTSDRTVVQLPKMQQRGFIQEIAMRSGSTLVLTGFENIQDKTDNAGIGQPRISLLGGKANTKQTRNVLVILLTPEILVSPLSPEARMDNF